MERRKLNSTEFKERIEELGINNMYDYKANKMKPYYENLYRSYFGEDEIATLINIKIEKNNSKVQALQSNEGFVYINIYGDIIYTSELVGDRTFAAFRNGVGQVCKNGKYGIIDTTGNLLAGGLIYDKIDIFKDGNIYKVRIDDKYGFITKDGILGEGVIYDKVFIHINGYAVVFKDDNMKYMDTKGKIYDTLGLTLDEEVSTIEYFNGDDNRLYNILRRAGITTMSELSNIFDNEPKRLYGIRGLGVTRIDKIKEALSKYNNEY